MNREDVLQLVPLGGFAAIFSGIIIGTRGLGPMVGLHLALVWVTAWLIFRLTSGGRRLCHACTIRVAFLPGGWLPASVLLLVMLAGGVVLGAGAVPRDQILASLSGSEVRALVTVTEVGGRDANGVRARGLIEALSGAQGPVNGALRRPVSILCSHDGSSAARPGCRAIRAGLTIAVRGQAGYTDRVGSFIRLAGDAVPVAVPGSGSGLRGAIDSWRSIKSFLCMDRLPGAASWLVPALVLGEGGGVPQRSRNALSVLGTAHLISVSGLHVVTVSGAVGLLVFILIGLPASRLPVRLNAAKTASVSTVGCAWLVALIAGLPPPAVRAAAVATLWGLARFSSRFPGATSTVCSAGMLEMLFAPEDAGTVSFQLSYAAVFGIMLAGRLLPAQGRRKGFWPRAGRFVASSLMVSVGASLATIPLTVIYFGSAPVVGPLANLVVVPMFTFVGLPGAFLTIILLGSGTTVGTGPAGVAIWLYCHAVDFMMAIQEWTSSRLPAILAWPPWPMDALAAACCTGAAVFLALSRTRAAAAMALLAAAAILLIPTWPRPITGQVVFLDVGKGDAAVLRCPSGSIWLVDAGAPEKGRSLLADGLNRNRVRHIDGVVVTHAHDDHYGGIPMLLDRFGPLDLAASRSTLAGMPQVVAAVRRAGGSIVELSPGGQAVPGCGIDTTVLAADLATAGPAHENCERSKNVNDDSLVFRFGKGANSILFAGDLETPGEKCLLALGVAPQAGILKVGHHGSPGASSPDFVSSVSPLTAIITGWPNGPRKAPSDIVLSRFLQSGSKVMATTLLGDVIVELAHGKNEKMPSSPVLKPQKAFPDGFGGRDGQARAMLKMIESPDKP